MLAAGLCEFEGVADHALGAEPGVHRDLGGDLVRGADADRSPVAGVRALGALADDDEVNVVVGGERRLRARVQARRTQVDVVVEREPHVQEETAFEDSGRDRRIADGAEEDRVVLADRGEIGIGQEFAGRVVPAGAEVVFGRLEIRDEGAEHLERFRRDLDTDAVTGDDRKFHEHYSLPVRRWPRPCRRSRPPNDGEPKDQDRSTWATRASSASVICPTSASPTTRSTRRITVAPGPPRPG